MTEFVNITSNPILKRAVEAFQSTYSSAPELAVLAPGRVNVIGEHVDYNGGWVLPAAINRQTVIVAREREDRLVKLRSANLSSYTEFSLDELEGERDWSSYVRGVLSGLQKEGLQLPGYDILIDSTIPVGGGLSSSAALEGATALLALESVGNQTLSRMDIARLCQQAEHSYAGVPCGIMDQAAVLNCAEGHLLLLDCRDETFQHVPFQSDDWVLMVINTNVAHELASGEYGKRRSACHDAAAILGVESLRDVSIEALPTALENSALTEEMQRCVRHVVTENDRTHKTVAAFARQDFATAGALLHASHCSLRDDYRVSCTELDFVVDHLTGKAGVAGCRMTGGGFGGSCIAVVRKDCIDDVESSVSTAYLNQFGHHPDSFTTTPQDSAKAYRLT